MIILLTLAYVTASEFVEEDRNDTLKIILKDSFFDNIQYNLIEPFFSVIRNQKPFDIVN